MENGFSSSISINIGQVYEIIEKFHKMHFVNTVTLSLKLRSESNEVSVRFKCPTLADLQYVQSNFIEH